VDGKALSTELINHGEHTDLAAIRVSDLDKVITPDVVRMSGPQAHAATVIEPESASGRLFLWDLQAFLPPDASDLGCGGLAPTSIAHHASDGAITIPSVSAG
jgi:hypothetical protein